MPRADSLLQDLLCELAAPEPVQEIVVGASRAEGEDSDLGIGLPITDHDYQPCASPTSLTGSDFQSPVSRHNLFRSNN